MLASFPLSLWLYFIWCTECGNWIITVICVLYRASLVAQMVKHRLGLKWETSHYRKKLLRAAAVQSVSHNNSNKEENEHFFFPHSELKAIYRFLINPPWGATAILLTGTQPQSSWGWVYTGMVCTRLRIRRFYFEGSWWHFLAICSGWTTESLCISVYSSLTLEELNELISRSLHGRNQSDFTEIRVCNLYVLPLN